MFKHLLVPLDGSHLAEAAIPAAICLAHKGNAAVTLLHLIERDAPETIHGEAHLQSAVEANAYLNGITGKFFPGIQTHSHVHTVGIKDVACGIADHLLELDTDTVVMSAHGWGGFRELLFGNIAQQVVALASMPVLLVKPEIAFKCQRVLIPHDGVPSHEPALNAGTTFARLCGAKIQLVMVVPTRGTLSRLEAAAGHLMPRAAHALLELAQQEAVDHLHDHVEDLKSNGFSASSKVLRGDPVSRIVEAGDAFGADVIVLGTHGKAGTKAFWEGSVAARVATRTLCALLFIPVGR